MTPAKAERSPERSRGFTLLELSIVLLIIAIVTGMAVTSGISAVATARLTATQKKMKAIDEAMMQYRTVNDRLPCPGDLTLTQGSANFGLEAGAGAGSAIGVGTGVCTGTGMLPQANSTGTGVTNPTTAAEGAVPAVTLGLPPDFMVDGWGNQLRYAVDISYTANAAFANINIGCTSGAVTVNDSNGNARSSGSVYALVSHGANGHGAYTKNGVIQNAGSVNANELTNCHCNSSGVATAYAPTYVQTPQSVDPANSLDNFDDLVTYKERWQLRTDWDKTGGCQYLYVPDVNNARVQKFNLKGNYLGQFGQYLVSTDGPISIAFDSSGNSWVVNTNNGTTVKFDKTNSFIAAATFGSYGSGNGQSINANAMAIDASGNFWVVDFSGHRVQEFNSSGTYIGQIGCPTGACSAGSGNGHFNYPSGIAIDSGGNLWVPDAGNNRVEKMSPGGTWLMTIGGGASCTGCNSTSSCTCNLGSGNGMFYNPEGVALDPSGNIWVADYYNSRVQKFASNGTWQESVGGTSSACTSCACTGPSTCPSSYGSGNGQLTYTSSLAIDSTGGLWVVDVWNSRIVHYDSSGNYVSTFGSSGSGNGQFNGIGFIAVK